MPKALLIGLGLLLSGATPAQDWSDNPEGQTLAQAIYERPASAGRVGTMNFKLINKRGRSRERVALMAHSEIENTTRVAIFFTAPAAIQNTAFLSHEHALSDDDAWLYLPATERVRRLPASERGDAFMGTDLSYGDIRDNFRFPPEYWRFRANGIRDVDGRELIALDGLARSEDSAREMGYGRFEALVDETSLFPVVVEYFDVHDQPLKRVTVSNIGLVGEAWTALAFEVANHQTGHRTEVFFDNMRAVPDLSERVFLPAALADGLPRIP
ncbi:MAG: outer membrane lipoprotein-sorting protein [Wenzhouxiangella sp.]|jgi:hypothetical protein|nr:outer membrane lipoprotein-sorting protein [Wenzhouxiangella sp.]